MRYLAPMLFVALAACMAHAKTPEVPNDLTRAERTLLGMDREECKASGTVTLHVLTNGTSVEFPTLSARTFTQRRDSMVVQNRRDLEGVFPVVPRVGLHNQPAFRVDGERVSCGHATVEVGYNPRWTFFCGDRPEPCAMAKRRD